MQKYSSCVLNSYYRQSTENKLNCWLSKMKFEHSKIWHCNPLYMSFSSEFVIVFYFSTLNHKRWMVWCGKCIVHTLLENNFLLKWEQHHIIETIWFAYSLSSRSISILVCHFEVFCKFAWNCILHVFSLFFFCIVLFVYIPLTHYIIAYPLEYFELVFHRLFHFHFQRLQLVFFFFCLFRCDLITIRL